MIFANWRGFSGGQRDMFDEVLKYGSLIVDAFVAHEQPVFVLIPPHAEIRGGAWVVLDASINSSVMELYATAKTARGGVLEANGAASVKYRMKDLIPTMHRLDEHLKEMDSKLNSGDLSNEECAEIKSAIKLREQSLLPVYEQIAVQFCDLHDTPGRMKAVGVIEKEVEWKTARTFFFWRLRRKLAEFDLRRKIVEAAEVGRSVRKFTPLEASGLIKQWFLQTPGMEEGMWNDDRVMLSWMAQNYKELEGNVINLTKEFVSQEVLQVLTAGGNTALIGTMGMVEGLAKACQAMGKTDRENFKKMVKDALDL
jgi:acetyl-CoA carboxylase/biotin carboxylase 1